MKKLVATIVLSFLLPGLAISQTEADHEAVLKTLDSWNQGWSDSDASLAVRDYAEDADWTNAFGDRFVGRDALRKGLEFIFSLDFVMAGDSAGNEFSDISFLSVDVALIRSKLVRAGKRHPPSHHGQAAPSLNVIA